MTPVGVFYYYFYEDLYPGVHTFMILAHSRAVFLDEIQSKCFCRDMMLYVWQVAET